MKQKNIFCIAAITLVAAMIASCEKGPYSQKDKNEAGEWEPLAAPERVTLTDGQARAAISEQGEIFFRYTGEELKQNGMRLPEITVEGTIIPDEGECGDDEEKGGEAL